MSGSAASANGSHVKRALAAVLTAAIPELHAFGDELANRAKRYPELVITELDSTTRPLGCGRDGLVDRGASGTAERAGRILEETIDLRLTLSAPNTDTASGAEIVQRLAGEIEAVLDDVGRGRQRRQVIDPVTGENQRVTSVRLLGARDLPPDTSGEPFLYRRALSVRVVRQVVRERTVDHTIERIDILNGGLRV